MSNMQVVLIKDAPGLGKTGEIVSVKPGYGRNYLLPQKLAVLPNSPEAKKVILEIKKRQEEKKEAVKVKTVKKIEQAEKHQKMRARKAKLLKK